MMKKSFITITAILTAMCLTGCSDFLQKENTSSLNQETYFTSDDAVTTATAPLYNFVWNDFNGKFYYGMGDGRANNITAQWSDYIYPYTNFNENALSSGLQDAWASLYSVVAQSNNTMNNIEKYSTEDVSSQAKIRGCAEARFMRGTAYWYIASLWGSAIIYESTESLVNDYVVPMNPRTDVMEFAARDLEYAAYYLPETASETGRVTKYSAYGMLSRIYLDMAGLVDGSEEYTGSNAATNFDRGTRNSYYLNLAKKAAEKAMEGPAKLAVNYEDLFAFGTINNHPEALFQLQWNSGSTDAIGWGCNQSIPSFFSWSTNVGVENWGGATCCSWDLFNEFLGNDVTYEPALEGVWAPEYIRMHNSVAWYGEEYPELGNEQVGSVYVYGTSDQASTNGANIKKYVVGNNKTHSTIFKQSYGINTYMLRLAEVYLNYCEAVLGNDAMTSDGTAVGLFNELRRRAGVPEVTEIDYDAIRHERRMEFAFEGLYWYDLIRRAYYQQSEVLLYVNSQMRNARYSYDESETAYIVSSDYERPGSGVATATASNLLLPVSDADKSKNHYLGESPQPYTFGERDVKISELF